MGRGPPQNTKCDPFGVSWAVNVDPVGQNIDLLSILESLWAAWCAQGTPKAPKNVSGDTPKHSKGHPWHQLGKGATTNTKKILKSTPQGPPNRVFCASCCALCLICFCFFWETANMQSAHACAGFHTHLTSLVTPQITKKH